LVESQSILLKRDVTRKCERTIRIKGRDPSEPVCACAPAVNQLPIGVERNLLVCFRPLTSAFCVCLSYLFPTLFVQALLLTRDKQMDVAPSIPQRSLRPVFQKFIWFQWVVDRQHIHAIVSSRSRPKQGSNLPIALRTEMVRP
jgi:hypothetical protein